MPRHTIANLFISAAIAIAVLIAITAAVNARIPFYTQTSAAATAAPDDLIVSRVITTIPFPLGIGFAPVAVSVNPSSGLAYVANFTGESVTVLSGTEAIAEISVDGRPDPIEVNPASGYVYAPLWSVRSEYRVAILSDTQLITSVTVGPGPWAVKANPATGYVYVANAGGNSVTILSGTQVITTVVVGVSPGNIAVNPVTGLVYVANQGDGTISILSGTNVITQLLPIAPASEIAANPVTGYAYATSLNSNAVSVLSNTQLITTITGISMPHHLGINSSSGYIYVVNDMYSITVLSGTRVITTVGVYWVNEVSEVAANPNTGFVYVTSPYAGQIRVLSATEIITTLAVPGRAIGVNQQSGYVYVTHYLADAVTVLSGTNPIATIKSKAYPTAIGFNSTTGQTYVACRGCELAVLSNTQLITNLTLSPYFGGGQPSVFETDPVGGYLYAGAPSGLIWISGTQIIDPPPGLYKSTNVMRANPATGLVYVANLYSMTVMLGSQVITSFNMPNISRITVNPSTGYVYVAQHEDVEGGGMPNTIAIISYTTVITSITFRDAHGFYDYSVWGDIEVNPNTGYVYASNGAILSGTTVLTTAGIVGDHIGVNPATGLVYISSQEALSTNHYLNTIIVVSGTQAVARLPVGLLDSTVSGIVVNPTSNHVYVAQWCCSLGVGTLTVISGTQVVDDLPIGQYPVALVMNTVNGLAYVANWGGSVSVIGSQIVPRSLTLGALFTPGDNIVLDFGRPVITTSLQFEISPTLPLTVTWSSTSDLATISHAPLATGTRYTLHVLPGGQAASGLGVAEWWFDYAYYPFHFFLPLIGK